MQNQTYYTPSSVSRYSSEIPIPPPLPATLGSTSRVGFPPAATTAIPAASIPPPLPPRVGSTVPSVIPAAATAIPAASYVAPAAVFAEPAQPQFVTAIPPGMPAPLKVETVTPFPEPTPVPFQSTLSHPPAAALTQQTTSTTYQPTAAYTTYYNSPYLAQYSNTPSVATPLSQPVTQPVFVTQTPSAVQASPITVNTSTTYVSPMEVLKAKIVNDLLLLYSGRPSQECFDNYAENAIMNSPLARGVNKTGIEATFACIPKFFTYWQVLNYQVDTTTAANQIFIDYNIRYNWKGGSKKRLHDMISHVVLTLDPHGKILSHEEVWDEGFGFKRKPNKGVSKLQQWISDAGGYITNAFGETRKWNNKMTGWNESHSNRPAPGTYYYTK